MNIPMNIPLPVAGLDLPGLPFGLRPELICLTCLPAAVMDRGEPIANDHEGHLIIVASTLVWPHPMTSPRTPTGEPR